MNEKNAEQQVQGPYRPSHLFYHANPKGTGCALSLSLHPAHDRTDGSIMLRAANQLTVGRRDAQPPTFPRFDWENAIGVKLDFDDLCAFLQVFRGECESINGDHGLFHVSPAGRTTIKLRHLIDPVSGYSLEIYRTPRDGGEETSARFLFSNGEACGVCEAIAGSMHLICFGIPMVIPHDTSAYQAAAREVRHVVAA